MAKSKQIKVPPLPDTSKWQPRQDKSETLKSAFLSRCLGIEKHIKLRVKLEKEMNLDNYDSGMGVEEIIRDEFTQLLPDRYHVSAGVVNDREGKTGGDFDLIIFNRQWFPAIKSGATSQSRRFHFPVDGIYALGEVKQTLDFEVLDQAMKKLVICHRLHRSKTFAHKLTENYESTYCLHGLSNPLYSFILATDVREGIEIDQLVERFFEINATLKRLEVVRALCVLGQGTVTWGFIDHEKREVNPAAFMLEDLYLPIIPVYSKVPDVDSPLYSLIVDLFLHLFRSVLAPEDIAVHYGPRVFSNMIPKTPGIYLEPDQEWLERLKQPCDTENHAEQLRMRDSF